MYDSKPKPKPKRKKEDEHLTYNKHPAKIGPRPHPIEATIDCNLFIDAG